MPRLLMKQAAWGCLRHHFSGGKVGGGVANLTCFHVLQVHWTHSVVASSVTCSSCGTAFSMLECFWTVIRVEKQSFMVGSRFSFVPQGGATVHGECTTGALGWIRLIPFSPAQQCSPCAYNLGMLIICYCSISLHLWGQFSVFSSSRQPLEWWRQCREFGARENRKPPTQDSATN